MNHKKRIQRSLLWMSISVIIWTFPLNLRAEEVLPDTTTKPDYSWIAQIGQTEAYGAESEPPSYIYSSVNRTGFIRKEPLIPNGSIFKVKDDKTMISTGDIIYIKPVRNSQLILGRYYTTYRTMEPMTDENTDIQFGTQYYLTGVVEITEKMPRFVIAKVTKNFRNIAIDDLLMTYTERSSKIMLTESKPGIEGIIIGPEEHSSLTGEHGVVFINKGSKDGIAPGQYYNIYYQEKAKLVKEPIPLDAVDFGTILVLHAEKAAATALVVRSEKNIYPGAKFHSPSQ